MRLDGATEGAPPPPAAAGQPGQDRQPRKESEQSYRGPGQHPDRDGETKRREGERTPKRTGGATRRQLTRRAGLASSATPVPGAATQGRQGASHAPGGKPAAAGGRDRQEEIDADLQETQPRGRQGRPGAVDVAAQGGETIRDRTVMLSEAAPRAQRGKGRGRQADQGRQARTQNEQGDRGARQDQGGEFETKPLEAARTLEALERGDTDLGQETT